MLTDTQNPLVISSIPQASGLDPDSLALDALKDLRRDWLRYARDAGLVDACMQVARWCGKPFTIRYREHRPAWIWSGYGLAVVYSRYVGDWLPYKGDFAWHEHVLATIGADPARDWPQGLIVMSVHRTDDSRTGHDNDIYVHGAWIEQVTAMLEIAGSAQVRKRDDRTKQARQELAGRLLLGKTV